MANANNPTGTVNNVLNSQYLELLLKNNPGVYISEKNYTLNNITANYNRLTLVIGSSRQGVVNLPVLCISPENFKEIYGDIDYLLEGRNSFFHRTVLDMLPTSPVICLNLRPWDNDLDMYNWINLSSSSDSINSNVRSNSIQDFYDISNGFWQRSPDDFINIVNNNVPSASSNPINFVNQGNTPVSILIFKSTLGGFDIPVEDWYKGNYPPYLHPKDYISDYMVQVIIVGGDWTDYNSLSNSPVWGKYFDTTGVIISQLEDFLANPSVELIRRYNVCLIPYFVDINNNDMWIQTIINNDVNETGVLCAFNVDIIETDYRNGLIDMMGDNLTKNKIPQINFLSYKKNMTDFYVIDETLLDSSGNSFGNNLYNFQGRTQIYCEGYVDGVGIKSDILSPITTTIVSPFTTDSGYGVINGVVIPIDSSITDIIALNNILVPNSHRAYVIVLTSSGIQFRLGIIVSITQNLFLPQINPQTEIVLAYYEFIQDDLGNYSSNFFPITVNENGYISPFRQGNESISKISFNTTSYNWIQQIYFENILDPNPQDYNQMRLYHLWYWLSNNLQEGASLIMDTNGLKQPVNWIEQGNDGSGLWIKIAISDMTSDIYHTAGTSGMISYYMQDIEFLSKNNKWNYNKPPLSFGTRGIIGYESFIKTSYLNGSINSGDPFFWSFSEEDEVTFLYDENINQNLIIIPNGFYNPLYYQKLVVIDGTQYNDGLWNFLEVIDYNGLPAIIVKQRVTNEIVNIITLYDATHPYIINLYDINGETTAVVDVWNGDPYELYQNLKYPKDPNSVWVKTLQIDTILSNNQIIVNWNRYVNFLEIGYFLLSNRVALTNNPLELVRNWTRIVDIQKLNSTQLLITTDSSIRTRLIDNVIETDVLQPIWSWAKTLNFISLNGFTPRSAVFPDGTDTRMNEILNLIAPNTRMQQALATDRMEWRYLIDSFGGGLEPESKLQLSALCLLKQFALGIINVPSIKQFRKDGTKYTTNGFFDTKKLISGGDRKNNTGNTYSLVSSGNGDTNVMYVSPFVSIFERNRTMFVPPASKIAQLYMRKHNNPQEKIWSPVAGILDSKITTITGLEKSFDVNELVDMNNFGITCLANFMSLTYYVYNQKTAVAQNSILQNVHCREALIELELSLLKGLREFQWSFIILENNTTIKDVQKVANDICQYYLLNSAISNYTNTFVITNQFANAQLGQLITNVELQGVMESIILQVNIMQNGTITMTKG